MPQAKTRLAVSRKVADGRISKQVDECAALLRRIALWDMAFGAPDEIEDLRTDFSLWKDYTNGLLHWLFDSEELAERFSFVGVRLGSVGSLPLAQELEYLRQDIQRYQTRLVSIHQELEFYEAPIDSENETPIGETSTYAKLAELFQRFHSMVRQLRNRPRERTPLSMDDEYDVQYLLGSVLRLFFEDVRPEEWTPSYAGSASRMDFILMKEKMAIEVKMTRDGLKDKQAGEQLILDIAHYRTHPDCDALFCFVYDPKELLANPAGLENDLSGSFDGFAVMMSIQPKG